VGGEPPILQEVLRSPGQSLDAGTRAFMEPRFGHDFSQIPTYTSKAGVIQTKLAINQPGDEDEREADLIADQVLAAPADIATSGAPPRIQRFIGQAPGPAVTAPASVDHVLASSGRPLDPGLRQDMEQRFGHDFSQVRVHSGAAAEQSARDVNAKAYTVGHDIVFGAGQLAPGADQGRRLIAHELTHVVQQNGGHENGRSGATLQRDILPGWLRGIAPEGADLALDLVASQWYNNPRNKQFINDLRASVIESPQHVKEFFKDEVLEAIKEHWLRIVGVTGVLLGLEWVIALLLAAPEPFITKLIAVIAQIVVIAILAYFVAVEAVGAYDEGRNWYTLARRANGDPAVIKEASRAFVRMVWHIVMAVLVLAGVRARWRGFTVRGGAAASTGEAGIGSGAGAGEPSNIRPITSARGYKPSSSSSPSGGPVAYRGDSAVLKYEPLETPVEAPAPAPAPAPAVATGTTPAPKIGPGVQPVPAIAAGVAAATGKKKKRPPFVLRLPQQKAPHLRTYRSWLGVLQSDPNYERGNPDQLEIWHREHRSGGGAHAIPASVYERGHRLGFTGESGERRIRVPDWSPTRSIPMEVDHIIELQVTPDRFRWHFNSVDNYELLDRTSNGTSGRLLAGNIRSERAKQVAFDPSAENRTLLFDEVTLDGGTAGERWSSEEIRAAKQLDAFEKHGQ
jgi:hypothetical protein